MVLIILNLILWAWQSCCSMQMFLSKRIGWYSGHCDLLSSGIVYKGQWKDTERTQGEPGANTINEHMKTHTHTLTYTHTDAHSQTHTSSMRKAKNIWNIHEERKQSLKSFTHNQHSSQHDCVGVCVYPYLPGQSNYLLHFSVGMFPGLVH